MNNLNQAGNAGEVSNYVTIARDLWPLFLIGLGIALASGVSHIKRSYLQRNKWQLIGNTILSSVVSSAVSLGFALIAPLCYPGVTPEVKIGIVLVVNGVGLKLFDAYMRKKHGLQIVDLMDPGDINQIRQKMSPEQRRQHVQNCPFKGDECCNPHDCYRADCNE